VSRRPFLKASGLATLLPLWPPELCAAAAFRGRRPSDTGWPSKQEWKTLSDSVGGKLISLVSPPLARCGSPRGPAEWSQLAPNLRNPYYIGDSRARRKPWAGLTRGPHRRAFMRLRRERRRHCRGGEVRSRIRFARCRQGRRPQLPGHVECVRFAADLDPAHERHHDARRICSAGM
jgi:hypothetical protein